jgi:SGNH domain (fused to AT3 domains)
MPTLGAVSSDPLNRCAAFNAALLVPLTRPRTAPVLLVANWQAYLDHGTMVFGSTAAAADPALLARRFTQTACALTRAGPTYALLPTPSFATRVPEQLQAAVIAGKSDDLAVPLAADRRAKAAAMAMLNTAAARCGLRLIDPAAVLCPGGQCRGSDQGHPLYYDRNHLTVLGAQRLAPLFAPLFAPPERPAR